MLYKKLDKEYKLIYQLDSKIFTRILTEAEYLTIEIHIDPKAEIISINEIPKLSFSISIFEDNTSQINSFFRELDSMLKSKISLFDALESLYLYTQNRYIKDMLAQLLDALNKGEGLYPTIKAFENELGKQTVEFIKIAQETGTIEEVISAISKIKEKEYEYKKKIKSAFAYPVLLIVSIFLALNVILFFVVPKFKELFINQNNDISNIPIPTQILFMMSDYMWIFALFPMILFILWLFILKYRNHNMSAIDIRYLPLIGKIIYYNDLTNFFLSIYLLIKAKYNIDVAIRYSITNIDNSNIQKKAQSILDMIYNGETLLSSFQNSNLFDDMVIRMINGIEKSNDTQKMFYRLYKIYEEKQENKITHTIKMIEPFMIILFSIIILFLALAIFLPLWGMNQSIM
jgi:general secretion pathway protein F